MRSDVSMYASGLCSRKECIVAIQCHSVLITGLPTLYIHALQNMDASIAGSVSCQPDSCLHVRPSYCLSA